MKLVLGFTCFVLTASSIFADLQPAEDARERFSTNFYSQLMGVFDAPFQSSFVISPGAVQKMLAAVYNRTDDLMGYRLVWDLKVKHADMKAAAESLRILRNSLKREDVVRFFEDDFAELDKEVVDNFWVIPENKRFSPDFVQSAQQYFNIRAIASNSAEWKQAKEIFQNVPKSSQNMNLLGSINLSVNLKDKFVLADTKLTKLGKFKFDEVYCGYNPIAKAYVLELPLAGKLPLTLTMLLPKSGKCSEHFLPAEINFDDFTKGLKEELVNVTLPKLEIESIVNLAELFSGETFQALRRIFLQEFELNGVFDEATPVKAHFDNFWHRSLLKIDSSADVDNMEKETNDFITTDIKTFDVADEPFFFYIRGERVIYFMGHYKP